MTAHEASEMAKSAGQNINIDKWIAIIREAAERGAFSVYGSESICIFEQNKLESLGYEVRSGFARDEPYYIISWK